MNLYVFIAGILGVFTTIGHFIMGSKQFLRPILESQIDQIPKKVMHSVFHYISVYLITSSFILLLIGYGINIGESELLIKFIAVNYAGFGIWQIAIALTSGIKNSLTKLFQWTFFILIAILCFLG